MSLKDLRVAKGLTQQQLGERVGMTQGRIADFEAGRRLVGNMTLDNAIDVLRATGHGRTANTVSRLLIEDASPKEDNA